MPDQTRVVSPGPRPRTVRTAEGQLLEPPADWVLVPSGDPGLTRRVKAAAPTWTVQERKGRKVFSKGVWAVGAVVESIRAELAAERSTPQYAKRRAADAGRREAAQTQYVSDFHGAVLAYLAFHPRYAALAQSVAAAVTAHATPVGSGTVARTQRIPVEARAEAAVVAWMRHRTTGYDNTPIPRIKGKRREVRRMLAGRSKALLEVYRAGWEIKGESCLLTKAVQT